MTPARHLLAAFILLPALAIAQETADDQPRTLFDDEISVSGGFLSFTPRFTNVMATDVNLVGFGTGVVIDKWLCLGLAGAWSTTSIKNDRYLGHLQPTTTADLSGLEMRYGYGGLLIDPAIHVRSAVHLSVPVIVGMGGVSYSFPQTGGGNNDNNRRVRTDGQGFFALEPGIELEVSVLRSLRIGVGGSYLYTSDLDLPNTAPDALRNFTARFTIKAGSFSKAPVKPGERSY